MRILFVCSGNTCRSPMAQALLRKALAEDRGIGLIEIEAWSAGICARPGQPASIEAQQVMNSWGIDITQHRTRLLEDQLVNDADLILTMTGSQYRHIKEIYPRSSSKVFTLPEYAGKGARDVADPYGTGVEVYMRTAQQIKELIEAVMKRLRNQK